MMDKQIALLEAQIRELEDELMNMCMERNVSESKVALMKANIKKAKRDGLIDDEFDLEQGCNFV